MVHILVIGAGRSSTILIEYLKKFVAQADVKLTIADMDLQLAREKAVAATEKVNVVAFNIMEESVLSHWVRQADIVISMMPPSFHLLIAHACIKYKKHMLSASYVSEEIRNLHQQAIEAGILILKECGLDPGLDHMTAMEEIDGIKAAGGILSSFKSFTGGLVAPGSDTNPWHYKFSWNPRNVVLAGQGVAQYIQEGEYKYIPYHKLFTRPERIELEGMGDYEGYANRDSLSYRQVYGIEDIPSLLRGTIRKKGFCSAWNVFVQLGMTDDSYNLKVSTPFTHRSFLNSFLPFNASASVEEKLCTYTGIGKDSDEFNKIKWLGLFEKTTLGISQGSPAQVLQHILEDKWRLEPADKDMIIMQHKFEYLLNGEKRERVSSLVCIGDDARRTAMSKTVGLPLGIAAKLLAEGKIGRRGVCLPVYPDIYKPMLVELEKLGIKMMKKDSTIA